MDHNFADLKRTVIEVSAKFKKFWDAPAERGESDSMLDLALDLHLAKDALVQAAMTIPDDDLLLFGRSKDGRLSTLNVSTKKDQAWQITRFDKSGAPWGDSQYTSKDKAVHDLLQEIDVKTLDDRSGRFKVVEPVALIETNRGLDGVAAVLARAARSTKSKAIAQPTAAAMDSGNDIRSLGTPALAAKPTPMPS
jgi:hypothetical protein